MFGAIPGSEVDWQLRIDYAQHAGSALVRWLEVSARGLGPRGVGSGQAALGNRAVEGLGSGCHVELSARVHELPAGVPVGHLCERIEEAWGKP